MSRCTSTSSLICWAFYAVVDPSPDPSLIRANEPVLRGMEDAVRRAAVRSHQGRALPARPPERHRRAAAGSARPSPSQLRRRRPSPTPSRRWTRSGGLLDKVQAVFFNLTGAETNDRLQEIAREVAPLLAALRDDILLDPRLFARVKAVWEQRAKPEARRRTEQAAGGDLQDVRPRRRQPPTRKAAAARDQQELSLLGVRFGNNLLKETNAYRLVIDKKEDLAGLPETSIAAAADAAKAAGQAGKWVFTLQAPSIWPFLSYADNRELRRQILTAYIERCDNGNESTTTRHPRQIATLRAEQARAARLPDPRRTSSSKSAWPRSRRKCTACSISSGRRR